eukprot:m.127470 g.127470  ORF g.127470 m.127470 type:complete len:588 (+) comp17411_c0_seq10:276-2039(+)
MSMAVKQYALWLLPATALLLSVITVYISLRGLTYPTVHHPIRADVDGHSASTPLPNMGLTIKTITVWYIGQAHKVRVAATSTSGTITATILAAHELDGEIALRLHGSASTYVAISFGSLDDGNEYDIILLPVAAPCVSTAMQQVQPGHQHGKKDDPLLTGIVGAQGIVLSAKPAKLPRVVITCLGTGRYRPMAESALHSAKELFGGDCEPSFHLLTDNITGIDPMLNPAHAPYREWPESGLSKFEDILNALRTQIERADYFFFLDADVRVKERIELADVAGDLVGVEHPMYPRYDFGWCKPGDPSTRGWCRYPFWRNENSTAYIPEGHGRYVYEGKYVVSNAYYYQSAFWGGKSSKVIELMEELIPRINTNRKNGIYSKIIQDELFLNWYLWKHQNDSDKNIRVLSPSYLYPFSPRGFTDWVTKENRPIIVHGIGKKPGKLINGAMEVHCVGLRQCVDMFAGTGWNKVGFYGCHHVADSQGFKHEASGIIRSVSAGVHKCMDSTGLKPLDDLMFSTCNSSNRAMQWDHDGKTNQLVNRATKLCLDPLRESLYTETVNKNIKDMKKRPLGVNRCVADNDYQKFLFRDI